MVSPYCAVSMTTADWHALVRAFIDQHRCHTPYFLEISQEFVQFLMQDYRPLASDPPFLAELAHYEWVELALDIAQEVLPDAVAIGGCTGSGAAAITPRLVTQVPVSGAPYWPRIQARRSGRADLSGGLQEQG